MDGQLRMIFRRCSRDILPQRLGVLVNLLRSTLLQGKLARGFFFTAQSLISSSEGEVNGGILRRKFCGGFKRLPRIFRLAGIKQTTAQAEMRFRKRWIELG